MKKTRALCLTGVSRHLETVTICFSVSGNPGQTLALVFDILGTFRSDYDYEYEYDF